MQLEFVKMQITNCRRPKHGRRYSPQQKSMCLAFYKQGPKLYRFQETAFILPTKRTLGRHSANLLFKSGVDFKVLDAVKNAIEDWPESDKYCVISWDEVSLKEHLDYCHTRDAIDGFVELANSRQPKFATHALTFMVRGINVSFKQSIGYFCTNGLCSIELVELVKLMIVAASNTGKFFLTFGDAFASDYLELLFLFQGLNPILSVCDQINVNANTVNLLINSVNPPKTDGRLLVYYVNGRRMIHSYDPSHLIKVVRNNWQLKDLIHNIIKRWRMGDSNNNVSSTSSEFASWDHIFDLYRKRLLPKLSDEHLTPNKYKMKVSLATELFSNTCGTVMLNCIKDKQLPEYYDGTAQFLLFMNDIFDSMNGSKQQKGDTLKCAVKENSIHFSFWEYALSVLPKMSFVNKSDGKVNNGSSVLKKLESTIRGYVEFSKTCIKLDIPAVSIRYFELDLLYLIQPTFYKFLEIQARTA